MDEYFDTLNNLNSKYNTYAVATVEMDDNKEIFHVEEKNGSALLKILIKKEYKGYPGGCEILHVDATSENSPLSPPNI